MGQNYAGELADILDGWRGRPVSVRVVAADDELVAVFSGTLGARSDAKGSALFWPVELGAAESTLEQPGIYVHPKLLSDVRLHTGGFVVEFAQVGTTLNVRQLADEPRS